MDAGPGGAATATHDGNGGHEDQQNGQPLEVHHPEMRCEIEGGHQVIPSMCFVGVFNFVCIILGVKIPLSPF